MVEGAVKIATEESHPKTPKSQGAIFFAMSAEFLRVHRGSRLFGAMRELRSSVPFS
jgi:hypothetical protein